MFYIFSNLITRKMHVSPGRSNFKRAFTHRAVIQPLPIWVSRFGIKFHKIQGHFAFLRCRVGVFLPGAEIPCIGANLPRLMPRSTGVWELRQHFLGPSARVSDSFRPDDGTVLGTYRHCCRHRSRMMSWRDWMMSWRAVRGGDDVMHSSVWHH